MFVTVIKNKTDVADQRVVEGALSDIAKQDSLIEYVAMMTDVDIPTEDEEEM